MREKHKKMDALLGTNHENSVMIRKTEEGDQKGTRRRSINNQRSGRLVIVVSAAVVVIG